MWKQEEKMRSRRPECHICSLLFDFSVFVSLSGFTKQTQTFTDLLFRSRKMGSVAKNGLNNYVKQLQEHPLRTKFWPVVGWINYKFMPLHFRVVFHSLIAFCWGIFLNLRARSMTLTKP
ncbi:Peroxisomal membrane protein pmp22, variant 2 [Lathyrus oleraceus]|uniref:Peroxisomal membrane protein pmp22, variant 2 n=1 Tax=Pisum sativum TaxID=3888 RepID=A0A9D5GZU5_PEA|nr:Peroxisomal membrane protein pmp22, variant 2 [Pisum sativum]